VNASALAAGNYTGEIILTEFANPGRSMTISVTLSVVPPGTVPNPPTNVVATPGNAQASVSFTAPLNDGGSAITGYTVTSTPAGGIDTNAGSTATTHTITGLSNGTPYTFTVTATNALGPSAPSAPSNSITPATVPNPPTAVTASAGNAQASVSFTAPLNNGGSAITGYVVTSHPAGGVDSNAGTTATTHTVTGLSNGTPYNFTVTASNAVGPSLPSAASNTVTPSVVPVAPFVTGAASRKAHGAVGTFDLLLAATPSNPTTEPRLGAGGTHTIVFTFDKPVTSGSALVTEGTAVAGVPTFGGNEMIVPLIGVTNAQYVTVAVSNVASADGGSGGAGSVRLGFLTGDVNGSRNVTLSDLLSVNAVLAQTVTAANFLRDVNVSGTLTLADKLLVNANLTQALPLP
jgi:hypothetical protein